MFQQYFTDGMPSLSEINNLKGTICMNKINKGDEMNILNQPTATYAQCEKWLKSKSFANPLALQNLPTLWDAAVKNGIDPVVLIAQAMLETGYFRFEGVIDATFHNTCGLKATKGGGDYVANAHMRFKTWEDGIQAHADHLGLYAGSPNCPKYSPDCASHQNENYKANGVTKDPRHFTYLYGQYKTVESLKGTWATDKQYDTKLIKMINEIRATEAEVNTMNNKPVVQKQPTVQKQQTVKKQQTTTVKKQPVKTTNVTKKATKQNNVNDVIESALNLAKKSLKHAAINPFKHKKR